MNVANLAKNSYAITLFREQLVCSESGRRTGLQESADKFECTRSNPNLQPKGFNISIVHFYFAFFASL